MGYEGCTAKLRMERVILEDSFFDETEYLCKIIAYDEEEETLYLRPLTEMLIFWRMLLTITRRCDIIYKQSGCGSVR